MITMRVFLLPVLLYPILFLITYIESTVIEKSLPLTTGPQRRKRNNLRELKSKDPSSFEDVDRFERDDTVPKIRHLRSADFRRKFKYEKSQMKLSDYSTKKNGARVKRSERDFYFRPVSSFSPVVDSADPRMYLVHRKERGQCFRNACHHGGLCVPRRHGFFCECLPGFIGTKCEVKRECKSNTCKNGGTCTDIALGKYLCTCPLGFLGENCEERSRCHPNPCRNGGTCSETEESHTCMCDEGYRGKDCEGINKCSPNPCKNAGICFELNNDFVCNCPQGFKGKTCEVVSECLSVYCLNGGTCRDDTNGYKCACSFGFYGKRCEASACHPNPCQNHGACLRFGNQYSCQCKQGFSGKTCKDHNPCSFSTCLNGGTCVDGTYTNSKYGFACICLPEFDGLMCEKQMPGPGDLRRTLEAI